MDGAFPPRPPGYPPAPAAQSRTPRKTPEHSRSIGAPCRGPFLPEGRRPVRTAVREGGGRPLRSRRDGCLPSPAQKAATREAAKARADPSRFSHLIDNSKNIYKERAGDNLVCPFFIPGTLLIRGAGPALLCWHLLIFPGRFQPSIVSASELNCRVRDGNGCTPTAIGTDLVTRTRFELVLPA